MRKKLSKLLIVLLIALAAYVVIRVPQWRTEDSIREAAFRYQFEHNGSYLKKHASAYYLALRICGMDTSPSPFFLRRFKHNMPPVRSCWHWRLLQDRRGLLIRAGHIKWLAAGRVDVEGGYYEDRLSASGYVLTMVRRHGLWVVVRDKLIWIS